MKQYIHSNGYSHDCLGDLRVQGVVRWSDVKARFAQQIFTWLRNKSLTMRQNLFKSIPLYVRPPRK